MNNAKVLLFTYNRLDHTKRTIEALKNNCQATNSDLIIFSDGYKSDKDRGAVESLREYLNTVDGFKSVELNYAPKNKGLAESVISGVSAVLKNEESVIVLEDDLITSTDFLKFMNHALQFYKEDARIWSISGYKPQLELPGYEKDVFLSLRASSWGWATWKDRWETIDWDVKDFAQINGNRFIQNEFNRGGEDLFLSLKKQVLFGGSSWAIRWCYSQFKQSKYTIYPMVSKIENIGFDESGVHGFTGEKGRWDAALDSKDLVLEKDLMLDSMVLEAFRNKYNLTARSYMGYWLKKLGLFKTVKRYFK